MIGIAVEIVSRRILQNVVRVNDVDDVGLNTGERRTGRGIQRGCELPDFPTGSDRRQRGVGIGNMVAGFVPGRFTAESGSVRKADAALRNSFTRLHQVANHEMHSRAQVLLRVCLIGDSRGGVLRLQSACQWRWPRR